MGFLRRKPTTPRPEVTPEQVAQPCLKDALGYWLTASEYRAINGLPPPTALIDPFEAQDGSGAPSNPPVGGSNVTPPDHRRRPETTRCDYCGRKNKPDRETCVSCGALL